MGLEGERPVAVVTGASGTIGAATVRVLAQRGWHTVMVARGEEKLGELAREIHRTGNQATPMSCDLTDENAIERLGTLLREKFGRLSVLVNNVGKELLAGLPATRPRVARELLDTNLIAATELTRCCLGMLEGGSVVNVASVAALKGTPGMSLYSAAKGALIAFSRSLARELAPRKIRVNVVAPGLVRSEMMGRLFKRLSEDQIAEIEKGYPLGFGDPEDVARGIAFLAGQDAAWITGQVLVIDGGLSS
jgi:3-oxoacyl-[acyl-carrier protein] reductase